ncbi:MAG: hypothetical protein DWB45_09030 [Xanthomonadales bacterium]|nr:hypothetical protein [Xanthomonadales bacterium]
MTATAAPREYALTSHEVADFRINGVVQAPTWLDVTLAQPHVLSVSVKPGASWGLHEDYIRVALNTPRQHEALIKVKADVRGDVVPSANPLDLGIMRAGNRNEALVRLNSRSQKAFKLGKIAVEGFNARTEVLPCRPKADGCKLVRVVVGKDQPAGSFRGTLHVELPELRTQLPVSIWGFLVPKDYKIRDVTPDPGQSKATAPASLHDELKASTQVKKSEQAPPPGDGPLLKWTASSLDTVYGFQIFRADSEQGPFLLINPKPVLADMNDENPQTFQWRDNDVRHGATYYYSIGILRVDGKKEHLAGPQKVVAK